MSTLVFLDTETTGLSLDDDIWELAAIKRLEDGQEVRLHLFIDHDRSKAEKLPEPFLSDYRARFGSDGVCSAPNAVKALEALFADRPHVVGAVPNFDTERIARLMRRYGIEPGWHYHLIDVENLAVGYLAGEARNDPEAVYPIAPLPWDSDALSLAVGVEPPAQGSGRHTAMGDVEWAKAVYDRIMSDDAA